MPPGRPQHNEPTQTLETQSVFAEQPQPGAAGVEQFGAGVVPGTKPPSIQKAGAMPQTWPASEKKSMQLPVQQGACTEHGLPAATQ